MRRLAAAFINEGGAKAPHSEGRRLVFLPRGRAERRCGLQIAHDALQAFIGLQRDVLRVFVAHGAKMLAKLGEVNKRTAKAARRLDSVCHGRAHCSIAPRWAGRH